MLRSQTFLRCTKFPSRLFLLRRSHAVHKQRALKYSYAFMPGETYLSQSTLGELVDEAAAAAGDYHAFVSCHQGIRKTFLEFKNDVDKLASGLISLGLRKGGRVGLCSPNNYEWAVTQFATAKAGLILVNVNPAYQAKELEYCLKKVGCNALITSETFKTQDFYHMLCTFMPELPTSTPGGLESSNVKDLKAVILLSESAKSGTVTLYDVMNAGGSDSYNILNNVQQKNQFDDTINIQFTSGTTGSPKGAALTHHNVVNNALIVGKRLGYHLEKPKVCCQVPLYHCFGCVLGTLGSVIFKNTCVFPSPSFDAQVSLKCIENEKCTAVYGTPTMFVDLLQKQETGSYDISCLKQAVIGGAPSPSSVTAGVFSKLKVKNVHIAYGSTENSPAVAVNTLHDDESTVIKGLVPPLEYVEVKVVNHEGEVVPVNTQGELYARGHILFIGYWGDKAKTEEVVDNTKWYHTGDLAEMNEGGYIRIVDRLKDMVLRGGENIYPKEIENFLHTHPSILEVHIVGVPDKRMGEELCAWIKLKDGCHLTEEEVKDFCKKKISHFKIPRYIMFVDDFPKTVSGKIQKFKMRISSTEKLGL